MSVDADRAVNLCASFHDLWRYKINLKQFSLLFIAVVMQYKLICFLKIKQQCPESTRTLRKRACFISVCSIYIILNPELINLRLVTLKGHINTKLI